MAGSVSLLMAALLGRWIVRDSRHLTLAAASLGRGEPVPATDRHSNTEFAALADQLAATGARLQESRDREGKIESSRRELVAWISHDLRTPLAGIRAMAEALEDDMVEDPAAVLRPDPQPGGPAERRWSTTCSSCPGSRPAPSG